MSAFSGQNARRWTVGLVALQVIVVLAACVAASIEIESILVTGPVLAVIGIAVGLLSRRWLSLSLFSFGLSGPLVAAFGAFIIALFRLGPQEATIPMLILLAVYLLAMTPWAVGLYMLVLSEEPDPATLPLQTLPWQYSMKTLLGLVTLVALTLGAATGLALRDFQIAFGAFALATAVICVLVIRAFLRRRAGLPPQNGETLPL